MQPVMRAVGSGIILALLVCQLTTANDCVTSSSNNGRALNGHAIRRITGINVMGCVTHCSLTEDCHSINVYTTSNGICELSNATHFSHPRDLLRMPDAMYMVYFPHPLWDCDDTYCSVGQSCAMDSSGNSFHCEACAEALGMEDSRIANGQITASSYMSANLAPWNGRLRSTQEGWAVDVGDLNEGAWLQIDIGRVRPVTKVATQGRHTTEWNQWVTQYYIRYGNDGVNFVTVQDGGQDKVFQGNSDRDTVVTHSLPVPFQAQYVRFVVKNWSSYITMRVELYGCAA